MRRRHDPLTVFAAAVAAVLFAVIIGALLMAPEPTTHRVVHVHVRR